MKDAIQWALRRRASLDVVNYRNSPTYKRQRLLEHRGIERLVDVGANVGQHGRLMRQAGYRGRIDSFEPLPAAFEQLAKVADDDPSWHVHHMALGSEVGTLTMTVTESSIFSSPLQPTDWSTRIDPAARATSTVEAPVSTLDDEIGPCDGLAVKMDVQGFEHEVIAGGRDTLAAAVVLEMEMSMVPLYEGQILLPEALELAGDLGFVLAVTENLMPDASGRCLAINGVFVRA